MENTEDKLKQLRNKALEISEKKFCYQTQIEEFRIFCKSAPTDFNKYFYKPMCILMLQGRKETNFGNNTYNYEAGDVLVVNIDVPTISRFVEASKEKPCIALVLDLDSDKLSKYIIQMKMTTEKKSEAKDHLGITKADIYILRCFLQTFRFVGTGKKRKMFF